jgi:class 3 adenylate cyclase
MMNASVHGPGSLDRARATEAGDKAWRDLLAQHHALVRRELARFRGEERDTAGDGFFRTFDGPARAIRAAQAILGGVHELGLELRAGVHTGEDRRGNRSTYRSVRFGGRIARLLDCEGPRCGLGYRV